MNLKKSLKISIKKFLNNMVFLEKNKSAILERQAVLDCFQEINLSREKMILYSSFIKLLHKNVYDTYLGKDCINTEESVRGHLRWCINKTIKSFKELNILFSLKEKMVDAFFVMFLSEHVYSKNAYEIDYIKDTKLIDEIFNYDSDKTTIMFKFIVSYTKILDESFVSLI